MCRWASALSLSERAKSARAHPACQASASCRSRGQLGPTQAGAIAVCACHSEPLTAPQLGVGDERAVDPGFRDRGARNRLHACPTCRHAYARSDTCLPARPRVEWCQVDITPPQLPAPPRGVGGCQVPAWDGVQRDHGVESPTVSRSGWSSIPVCTRGPFSSFRTHEARNAASSGGECPMGFTRASAIVPSMSTLRRRVRQC